MTENPYKSLPDYAFWRRSVADVPWNEVDPVVRGAFKISKTDKVATAGSCFAQHIARYLSNSGFNYYVSEQAHPIIPAHIAKGFGYGEFTARYGNIYTARQLNQLFDRAYGDLTPKENIWRNEDGDYIDPYRPNIQPGGFKCELELEVDRKQHLAAVREAFEELDVFVFTLGLTESWVSNEDGMAFPLCPGVVAGKFDPKKYSFKNFSVSEVTEDMADFVNKLLKVNPSAKVILTVSPVPLIATMEDRHVLTSTTYSKSVLRIAAEEISTKFDSVAYFPSFEIITGSSSRGRYFAQDCRSVIENGVSHVMGLFLKHYTDDKADETPPTKAADSKLSESDVHLREMERLVEVNCDEVALDQK